MSSKTSSRLATMMRISLDDLEEIKSAEEKKRHTKVKEGKPYIPFTFGLYFPEHEKAEVAAFTDIDVPFVLALIKSQASRTDLVGMGVEVRSQAGDIFSVNIPFHLLPNLIKSQFIDYIEIARPSLPDLGQSIPFSGLGTIHENGSKGNGVIIGVIDDYLDVHHIDFRHDDGCGSDSLGSSRVSYIWNQGLTKQNGESSPSEVINTSYGVEYDHDSINRELGCIPSTASSPYSVVRHHYDDSVSLNRRHGTSVAGCAVGNSRSLLLDQSEGVHPGAAPEADIIFVCLRDENNYILADHTTLADAFLYIFSRASLEGKPCIVNRSGSDDMGPHDGKTLGEQFLDNLLLEPKRVITLSAGNSNKSYIRRGNSYSRPCIHGHVGHGSESEIILNYQQEATEPDEIEIWYDGQDVLSFSLDIPDGRQPIEVSQFTNTFTHTYNNTAISIEHINRDGRNNDNRLTILIRAENPGAPFEIPGGDWEITVKGVTVSNGHFSAWVDINNQDKSAWKSNETNRMSIGVPATSYRSIAVGNHSLNGASNSESVDMVKYSGAGPTRDNRIKPDICADGDSVKSVLSVDRNISTEMIGGNESGTSMSAPIVAGACACLFECRGHDLSWYDIKQILWENAGQFQDSVSSNQAGFGYLQMTNACESPLSDVDVWLKDHESDTGIEPFPGEVTWLSPDIQVLDLAGNPVANPSYNPDNFINNLVTVSVRNKGTQTARNVEVYLHWADPATHIPFPIEWKVEGIYTPNNDNEIVEEANKIVIPELPVEAITDVTFGWAPPPPGSNIRGDDHFCLIVRLEEGSDSSNVLNGGWNTIRGSNNIALRNTHVLAPLDNGSITSSFFVTGSDDIDGLWIDTEELEFKIIYIMPVEALVYRSAKYINEYGKRPLYGSDCKYHDPLVDTEGIFKSDEVEMLTGIVGAEYLEISKGKAHITKASKQRLFIPRINLANSVKMPVNIQVIQDPRNINSGLVHVGQYSGGRKIGGLSLDIRNELSTEKKYRSSRLGNKLVIEPL